MKKIKSIIKVSHVLLSFSIIVLTSFCIYQIINMTQERYLAESYQRKINTISRENYTFSHNVQDGISLSEVEEIARERSFTEVGSITYIKVPSTEVVVR